MKTDFIVIGSGIAGLNFSLKAAEFGNVLVITKKTIRQSNTNYAQGGIAAVLDQSDTLDSHYEDTLKAGGYHNNKRAVKFMVKRGPALVLELSAQGVPFQQTGEALSLTLEGGHSTSRIAYVGDKTGQAIEQSLVQRVRRHPQITFQENAMAIDLIVRGNRCYGVQYMKENKIHNVFAKATILATGGLGQLYRYSTNPAVATGDGVAMAARAGCELKDLEFIQFHPTALDLKDKRSFLLSESLRGEGAYLKNAEGRRFMQNIHPLKELAPRDIVSRAVFSELRKGPVYLDITHKKSAFLAERFPIISRQMKTYGLDLSRDLIPVSPATHYSCGGVKVNLQGETSLKNLFAFGEVACTGVHGANRLASNSLLESLVFSNEILKTLKCLKSPIREVSTPEHKHTKARSGAKRKTQNIMWDHVGIVRSKAGLREAIEELDQLESTLPGGVNQGIIEARNLIVCGRLIAQAALKRKKSLGCHYRLDSA
ncbi:MAG: L-aspartate oxidase [Nitrospinaceae bacterium]|jgi:L-aspartate oxidase|nr:L-aspartate oxidase [Nitrospinaceae bacterium]MBT3434422.1 L-aspartate oxidase [Nitrospinaceae bacterium]MBT4094719.1 L-aspartate oxidase [Nitrospinaceae bacterium]MBT4432359.1 L-aspartate oxidase [Nitrospinaceae bacterium]MBT5368080.1 L-aspartate oxidase [Nitrospinaceae bacterium]